MFLGVRILRGFSLRGRSACRLSRWGAVVLIGRIQSLVVTVLLVIVLGAFAGIAYVTGYTIVGSEVGDDTRGRTFAFLQSGIRVILFAVIAIAPILAAAFTALVSGATGSSTLASATWANAIGYNLVLILSAVVAVWLGLVSSARWTHPGGPLPRRPGRGGARRAVRAGARPSQREGAGHHLPRAADRLRGR